MSRSRRIALIALLSISQAIAEDQKNTVGIGILGAKNYRQIEFGTIGSYNSSTMLSMSIAVTLPAKELKQLMNNQFSANFCVGPRSGPLYITVGPSFIVSKGLKFGFRSQAGLLFEYFSIFAFHQTAPNLPKEVGAGLYIGIPAFN